MIGHAMPAAGIAGLIKTALALHHRVLPPTLHADHPHPLLDREDSPFTLSAKPRPWVHGDPTTPRRAGVNAFGFAGINAHAVLEEHASSADADDSPGALLRWDTEAVLLSAPDRESLIDRGRALLGWLLGEPDASLKDLAYTLNTAGLAGPIRLGLVATSLEDLAGRLQAVLTRLADPTCRSIRDARGTYFWERVEGQPSKLAFLFPGEGSQYPGMLADLCPHFPEIRALFDTSDRIAREAGASTWPSEHLFGDSTDSDPALWSAEVAVNVVLSAQWAIYQLLIRLGLRPDAVAGHSSGELLALAAAGVVEVDRSFEDRLGELGAIFGQLETSGHVPSARLVAVAADRSKVEDAMAEVEAIGWVEVAMDNCPHQVVLAGEPQAVEAVVARLRGRGLICEDLPFHRAYHTPGFGPAMGPIEVFFDSLRLGRASVPLYSCATEGRMPDDPAEIRRRAVDQWTRAVGFRRTVEAMHGDGLRVFVDVGARGNLAGFVEDTLRGRPSFAVAANLPRRSGLAQLNHLVASLFAQGVEIKPDHLYARRRPIRLDLQAPPPRATQTPALAVGFPSMKLSEGLIERLKTVKVDPTENGYHSVETDGRYRGSNGIAADGPVEVDLYNLALPSSQADATMLGFQETMAAFLRTQQAVMDAFLSPSERLDEDFSLHLSNDAPAHLASRPGPWAGELVSWVDGLEAVSMVTLDAAGDPVAEHHTLGGRRISALHPDWRGLPVLPFSVMAEMLAEAAARLIPGKPLVALREVQAHRWIRYEVEPVALELRATLAQGRPNSVNVSIHNRGPSRAMRPAEAPVFEGLAVFGDSRPDGPIAGLFQLEGADMCRFTPRSIYAEQWLFHGPALQAVVGIGPISMGGIEGTLRILPFEPLLRDGEDSKGLLTDPIILDNFTHLLGGWGLDRLADDGDVIFPLRMEGLTIHGEAPPEGSDVSCRISIRERERHRVRVDADIVGPDGRIWMEIRGWEDWRFHWPGRYRDGFRQPDRTFLGKPLDLPGRGHEAIAVWLEPPPDMGRPIWRDVLEHVQMGPDERAVYLALPGPDLRRTHRLWGRIAAKEAARRFLLDRGGSPIYPADLVVERDPLGRPTLRSRLEPDRDDLPALSIAHVDGVAVALAGLDPSARVGIDVEPIVERSAGFEAAAFTTGERAILERHLSTDRAEWIARLWCAKEATAKATGLGFVDGPSGVEVVAVGPDGSLGVRLQGGLAEACVALARGPIRVVTARRGEYIWAWTLGEGMES
jgi:malonyl CoA-acyl carrier protein transacylase/phosphopantetheinyl transferase